MSLTEESRRTALAAVELASTNVSPFRVFSDRLRESQAFNDAPSSNRRRLVVPYALRSAKTSHCRMIGNGANDGMPQSVHAEH